MLIHFISSNVSFISFSWLETQSEVLHLFSFSLLFFWTYHTLFFFNSYVLYNSIQVCVYVSVCFVISDSLQPHGLHPARLLCPQKFLGKNPGVGCHFLQEIFLTQSRTCVSCVSCISRQILYRSDCKRLFLLDKQTLDEISLDPRSSSAHSHQ